MRYLLTSLCLGVISSGCSGSPAAPQLPSAPLSPGLVGFNPDRSPISVGQLVTGTLRSNGAQNQFELTATSSGTLTVTVSWDGDNGIIELALGSSQFGYELGNPLTGRVAVVAGEKYLITVYDPAAWDYHGLHLPYTFTSSIH